jgi:hypothetical protein
MKAFTLVAMLLLLNVQTITATTARSKGVISAPNFLQTS